MKNQEHEKIISEIDASFRLEGLPLPEDVKQNMREILAGRMTVEQAKQLTIEKALREYHNKNKQRKP